MLSKNACDIIRLPSTWSIQGMYAAVVWPSVIASGRKGLESACRFPASPWSCRARLCSATPYRQAEDARRAVLEKHVKLTTAPTELRQINGKQVCWNYRKGRCRFGRGCKFAHDSDLQRDDTEEPGAPLAGTETLAVEAARPAVGVAGRWRPAAAEEAAWAESDADSREEGDEDVQLVAERTARVTWRGLPWKLMTWIKALLCCANAADVMLTLVTWTVSTV